MCSLFYVLFNFCKEGILFTNQCNIRDRHHHMRTQDEEGGKGAEVEKETMGGEIKDLKREWKDCIILGLATILNF